MPVLLWGLAIWALRIGAPWLSVLLTLASIYEFKKDEHPPSDY